MDKCTLFRFGSYTHSENITFTKRSTLNKVSNKKNRIQLDNYTVGREVIYILRELISDNLSCKFVQVACTRNSKRIPA